MAGAGARAKIRGKGEAGATFKTFSLFYKYLGAEQRPDLRTLRDHPLFQAAPQYHCPPAYLQHENRTYRKNSQVEMGPEPKSVKQRLYTSVVDPNTLYLNPDQDPGQDPDP